MLKNIIAGVLFAATAALSFAAPYGTPESQLSGGANIDPKLDFFYHNEFINPASSIRSGGEVKLQARFVWNGTGQIDSRSGEHAIVAYVHGENPGVWNVEGQKLWNTGVGAFVQPTTGLNIELWHQQGKAWWWNKKALGGNSNPPSEPAGVTLVNYNNGIGYVTGNPNENFVLKRGTAYWVRMSITHQLNNPQFALLKASLVEETATGPVLLQEAAFGFVVDAFFPPGENIKGVVARTGSEYQDPQNVIGYYAFNY